MTNESMVAFEMFENSILKENFIQWKQEIAYLTYLFAKFNKVNFHLQGDNLIVIKRKSIIAVFLLEINLKN